MGVLEALVEQVVSVATSACYHNLPILLVLREMTKVNFLHCGLGLPAVSISSSSALSTVFPRATHGNNMLIESTTMP